MQKNKDKKIKGKTKIIFITGGVISGIGKGIVAASIGNILKAKNFSVFIQKLDPYLNYDPGVLSPYEHGEVYVTADGGETDLDLGHYERFINEKLTKYSNFTSGSLFMNLNKKERKGVYQGKTVQIFPHFTDEIIFAITKTIEKIKPDFFIVEIGGTVGDMESISFLRAISELGFLNPKKCFYIHTTYIPFLNVSNEFKTKPTQFSIQELNSFGIKADMVFLRSQFEVTQKIISKISFSLFLDEKYIISLPNLKSVYKVPAFLEAKNISNKILEHFNIPDRDIQKDKWKEFIEKLDGPKKHTIKLAMIGKYIGTDDTYNSIKESINIASIYNRAQIEFEWLLSDEINESNVANKLKSADGVVILPGFGARGFEGKVCVAKYTKEKNIPTLGICLGMQAMTIAQARAVGLTNATSSEFKNKKIKQPYVFDVIKGKNELDLGGSLRLGEYKVNFVKGSKFNKVYKTDSALERHRHRYEFVRKYRKQLEVDSFLFSGIDSEYDFIETCEIKDHVFYLGTQYHPEFSSNPNNPHPLFDAFLKACITIK